MRRNYLPWCVLTAALTLSVAAQAQEARPAPPQQPDPLNTIPERIEPPMADPGDGSQETLSEQLDATGGIIRPPSGVDPEIHAPAPIPEPGTMPVIPPPGTPGGDPTIVPK